MLKIILQKVNLYYVAQYHKQLPVVICPLAILADRPERCSLSGMLSFTGNATRRWLYSSLVTPNKLASCQTCVSRRLKRYFSIANPTIAVTKTCGRCCDFEFLTTSPAAEFSPPSTYPKTKHVDSLPFPVDRDVLDVYETRCLKPIKLPISLNRCAPISELPCNVSTMDNCDVFAIR